MGQEKTFHDRGIAGRRPLPLGTGMDEGDSGHVRYRAGHGQCPGTFDHEDHISQRDCRPNPARLLWRYLASTQ